MTAIRTLYRKCVTRSVTATNVRSWFLGKHFSSPQIHEKLCKSSHPRFALESKQLLVIEEVGSTLGCSGECTFVCFERAQEILGEH